MLIGHVGQNPDVKRFDNGGVVAQFSLATTDKGYTRKDGTKTEDKTEWHNIVLYNSLAEVAEKYVHKGDKLYIEGKVRTRSYEDKNGATKYITEVYGHSMEMSARSPARGSRHRHRSPRDTTLRHQLITTTSRRDFSHAAEFKRLQRRHL